MKTTKVFVQIALVAVCFSIPVPTQAGHSATMLVAYQMQQGDAAMRHHDWRLASGYYYTAVEMDYHNSVPHSQLGWAYLHEGSTERATTEFRVAQRLNPLLPSAQRGLQAAVSSDADR